MTSFYFNNNPFLKYTNIWCLKFRQKPHYNYCRR